MTPESIRIQKLAYQCGIDEWEIGYEEFTSAAQARKLERLVKLAGLVRDAERHRIYAALEALAQQPAAVVELTDEEILHIHTAAIRKTKDWHVLAGLRAVIAAHIAKQSGGAT